MLNPKTYQTSTPEIDPGEAPPGRPSRRVSADTRGNLEEPVPTIDEVRSSAARLLQDAERAHSPRGSRRGSRSSFPFDNADNNDNVHDQLPSVEEARLYAGRILGSSSTGMNEPLKMDRTVTISSSGDPYAPTYPSDRRRLMRRACYVMSAILVVIAIAGIAVAAKRSTSSASTAKPSVDNNLMTPRFEDTLDFLNRYEISDPDTLLDVKTPQFKAAKWMANEDTLQYDIPQDAEDVSTRFLQRYALAVFYYAMDGIDWSNQLNFMTATDECSWFKQITLGDGENIALGVTCSASMEAQDLLITSNNLYGELPPELTLLKRLEFVDLKHNNIKGQMPEVLGSLRNMKFFDLRFNMLEGVFPHWIGNDWTNLRVLALSRNMLSGAIPATLANLQELRTLALDENLLDGDVQTINPLSKLEYVYLDDNDFTGSMDGEFLVNLSNLVQLDLSQNELTGKLSEATHFWSLENLGVLDLHDNDLTGEIFPTTDVMPGNTALEFLALYENLFTGTISGEISMLENLKHFDVTGNALTGTIPQALSGMSHLTYLFLSQNDFLEGTIPAFLSECTNLRELSLANTNRVGPIEGWISELERLVLLDLSNNGLNSTVPAAISVLDNLHYLLLQRNQLQGPLPTEMNSFPALNMVMLDNNNFDGDVSPICTNNKGVRHMSADCEANNGAQEVTCTCCTMCCADSDRSCNTDMFYGNLDPQWEHNYTRVSYSFSPSILFENE